MNHLSFSQAIEAVINGQHAVTLDDAYPDGGADSSIHPGAGSANVHDGHVNVALVQRGGSFIKKNKGRMFIPSLTAVSSYFNIWRIDMGQQLVSVPVVLKTPTLKTL